MTASPSHLSTTLPNTLTTVAFDLYRDIHKGVRAFLFDVTVAAITGEEIAVRSTAGDHDLGGKNWDDRIATFLAERFAADTGFDPLDEPVALNEVLVRSDNFHLHNRLKQHWLCRSNRITKRHDRG